MKGSLKEKCLPHTSEAYPTQADTVVEASHLKVPKICYDIDCKVCVDSITLTNCEN